MKKILFTTLSILCLTNRGEDKNPIKVANKPAMRHRHHRDHKEHTHVHPHKHQMHIREEQESFDDQRKEMNIKIGEIQHILKKNNLALGVERRQIGNLNSSDLKNKAKKKINAICDEIKEAVNQFQSRIGNIIDAIE